jgi:hypothetical protein
MLGLWPAAPLSLRLKSRQVHLRGLPEANPGEEYRVR